MEGKEISEYVNNLLANATSTNHLAYGIPHLKEFASYLEVGDIIYIPKNAPKYFIQDKYQANVEKGFALCKLIKADKTVYDFPLFPSFLITSVAQFDDDGEIMDEVDNDGSAFDYAMQCWIGADDYCTGDETVTDCLLRMLEDKAIKIESYLLIQSQKITGFTHDKEGNTYCEVDDSPEKVFTMELIDSFEF